MSLNTSDGCSIWGMAGDYAQSVAASELRAPWLELQSGLSLRAETCRALNELHVAGSEASAIGWDGYEGKPMPRRSFDGACQLLFSFPSALPAPEIEADPRGGVLMSWRPGGGRAFSLSIDEGDRIHYAGFIGETDFHGSVPLHERLPDSILEGLRRIHAEHR